MAVVADVHAKLDVVHDCLSVGLEQVAVEEDGVFCHDRVGPLVPAAEASLEGSLRELSVGLLAALHDLVKNIVQRHHRCLRDFEASEGILFDCRWWHLESVFGAGTLRHVELQVEARAFVVQAGPVDLFPQFSDLSELGFIDVHVQLLPLPRTLCH